MLKLLESPEGIERKAHQINMKRYRAKIIEIRQETPKSKSFRLQLEESGYTFLAGQWLDLYLRIDGQEMIGGYSPTSSPLQTDQIELTVRKANRNPVSRYLHEHAQIGEQLLISAGQGDFFYRCEMASSLVLIGGGIGLTPLMSIIRYTHQACPDHNLQLLYSIREENDYLFREELQQLENSRENFSLHTTTTGDATPDWHGARGRITDTTLQQQCDPQALYYLCGPASFCTALANALTKFGISAERIRFEDWTL